MAYYIGIDLGTSALKALVVNEQAEVLFSESASYENAIFNGNWSEQNPNDWFDALQKLFAKIPAEHKALVEAISFSGQMHGLVVLDDQDKIIRPAILWNDQRCVAEAKAIEDHFGLDKLATLVANRALVGFTAPKVLWMRNHEPELFKLISKVMLPKDYLLYQLSGVFASDVSDSSGTLYFDVKKRQYGAEMRW
jgi:xylulokinase